MTVFDFSALSGWTHCLSYVLFLVHALQFYFYYLTETTMCPKHFNICYLTCFSKSLQEVVIITPTLAGKSEKQPCQFAAGLRLTLVLLTPTPGSSLDHTGIPVAGVGIMGMVMGAVNGEPFIAEQVICHMYLGN